MEHQRSQRGNESQGLVECSKSGVAFMNVLPIPAFLRRQQPSTTYWTRLILVLSVCNSGQDLEGHLRLWTCPGREESPQYTLD